MFNIYIKGKYDNEKQLIGESKLPKHAIMFEEGDSIQSAFNRGFLVSLPLILFVIAISIYRCININKIIDFDAELCISFVITFIIIKGLAYVHEFIHAIFYPRNITKTIWKDSKNGAFFVYCDAKVSKIRFILLCLAPAIILGFFPFVIWLLIAPLFKVQFVICFMIITWVMIVMSIGDYANVYNAIKQVPKNAKVFNYGMHSYWITNNSYSLYK